MITSDIGYGKDIKSTWDGKTKLDHLELVSDVEEGIVSVELDGLTLRMEPLKPYPYIDLMPTYLLSNRIFHGKVSRN
jgi:hypothetical protein